MSNKYRIRIVGYSQVICETDSAKDICLNSESAYFDRVTELVRLANLGDDLEAKAAVQKPKAEPTKLDGLFNLSLGILDELRGHHEWAVKSWARDGVKPDAIVAALAEIAEASKRRNKLTEEILGLWRASELRGVEHLVMAKERQDWERAERARRLERAAITG